MTDLYTAITRAGIPVNHHESDLYFPVTNESRAILKGFPGQCDIATTFNSSIPGGGRWFDVSFAYMPYWEGKRR